MRPAYYNEIDEYVAEWLRNLIAAGHLPAGHVDTRSIADVSATDLAGYGQCHFFAGIGGWALAARLAGWPDGRELWSGSCPCQPFSVAGKQAGFSDERDLWPHFFRLIRARRPDVVVGEQVAAAVGKDWLDRVFADLEGIGYACGAAVVPACAVNAPHRRDRLWFVGGSRVLGHSHSHSQGLAQRACVAGISDEASRSFPREIVADAGEHSAVEYANVVGAGAERQQRGGEFCRAGGDSEGGAGDVCQRRTAEMQNRRWVRADGWPGTGNQFADAPSGLRCTGSAWHDATWIIGHDGKARRVEPSIRLLAHGVPARVGRLRAYGNAIVPEEAAQVIGAYLDAEASGMIDLKEAA